jgi:hypothetical protein
MKLTKKVIFIFLTLCIVLSLKNSKVYAAAGTISFSDPSVTLGNEVSVKVKVSTTDDTMLGGVDLTLAYDDSSLEFVSGTSASGSSGTIRIAGVIDNASTTSLSYTLTFNTLKAGTSSITVSSYEIISLDYEPISISKVGSSAVTIKEKETVKASSDCKLSALNISPGTLSPSFSPTTVEYSATVAYATTKIAVSATPNDSKASVTEVTGTDLSVGSNTVRVVVTAESGASVAYVINVTREAQVKQEEPSDEDSSTQKEEDKDTEEPKAQEESIEISIGDAVYHAVSDIPEEIIPEAFEESAYTYQDTEVKVLKSDAGDMILFYLEGEEGVDLYLYDEETDSFTKYILISFRVSLIVLEPDESVTIPEGFTQASLTFNESTITAYQSNQNPDFYLVYGRNAAGEKALYLYDTVEGSLQRYVIHSVEEEENADGDSTTITELENQLQELNASFNSKLQKRMYILYALAVIATILLILSINLILKNRDIKEHEAMEDDNSTDDFENYIEYRETKVTDDKEAVPQKKKSKGSKPKKIKQKEAEETNDNGMNDEEFEITFIDLNDEEKTK